MEQKETYLYDEAHASDSFPLPDIQFTAEELGTIAVMAIQGLLGSQATLLLLTIPSAPRGVQRVLGGFERGDCWQRISFSAWLFFVAVRETLADRVPILRRVEDAAQIPHEAGLRVTASPPIVRILPNLLGQRSPRKSVSPALRMPHFFVSRKAMMRKDHAIVYCLLICLLSLLTPYLLGLPAPFAR